MSALPDLPWGLAPIDLAAPLVALVAVYAYLYLGRRHFGPEADYWEVVRRTLLPQLERLSKANGVPLLASYRLTTGEYLGSTDVPPDAFERDLHRLGFERMPLAAFKYAPDGRPEVGSWAYRDGLFDTHQLHAITFQGKDGGTDVYAHAEHNALHPLYAAAHYTGVGYTRLGDQGVTLTQLLEAGPANVLEVYR